MKATWLSTWITLLCLALFFGAAWLTPETPSGREQHREVATAWQRKQIDKAAANGEAVAPPPAHSLRFGAPAWLLRADAWDRRAFVAINRGWDNRFFDAVMPWVTNLGNGGVQAAGLLALWLWARLRKRKDWSRTALLGVVGIVLSIVAPQVKLLLPRYRPPSLLPYDVVLLVHPLYGGSFPSGHSMSSFAIATVIAIRHRWAAVPAFTVAALVGLSRISVGVHWPTDVLGGAAIGTLLGWAVAHWGREKTGEVI